MNRAYLALVQTKIKELEKAQYQQASACASGIPGYGQAPIDQATRNLKAALDAWGATLETERAPRALKEAA